jgi:hypothetical protein
LEDFLRVGQDDADWDRWLDRQEEALWHREIEWDASGIPISDLRGIHYGPQAVRRWWEEWLGAWNTMKFEYKLIEAGDDRVVLLLDQHVRGRSTGIELPLGKYAQIATFKDGRIVHWKIYVSQAEALEVAGLSE